MEIIGETFDSTPHQNKRGIIWEFPDGPAVILDGGDYVEYWVEGKLSREDAPAIIDKSNGREEYWFRNLRHRLGGPAIIQKGEIGTYWVAGEHYDEKIYKEVFKTPLDDLPLLVNKALEDNKYKLLIRYRVEERI